jgi:hypothetical protein
VNKGEKEILAPQSTEMIYSVFTTNHYFSSIKNIMKVFNLKVKSSIVERACPPLAGVKAPIKFLIFFL